MIVVEVQIEHQQQLVLNKVNTIENDVDYQHRQQHDDVEVIDEQQQYYLVVQEIPNLQQLVVSISF
jgi:hypothetical protein